MDFFSRILSKITVQDDIIPAIVTWLKDHGVTVLLIAVIALLVNAFSRVIIEKLIRKIIIDKRGNERDEKKREDTLIRIFDGSLHVIVWIVAGMMILAEFGVDIGPLIASAGVVGLAFGFGGQYLIRDVISGLFIILENQYRVGDLVDLDGATGTVEDITLRSTILRDVDGAVHYIPNGNVQHTVNKTKDFAQINLNIGIGYDSDIERVETVVNELGQKLAENKDLKSQFIEPIRFVRVQSFGASEIVVRISGKVIPRARFEVTGIFRRELKKVFDKEGIDMPFPQQVIHYANK